MSAKPTASAVMIEGPWQHRELSANGSRFHLAEAGQGPLVLLLHGFPEFWWSWRVQLPALAAAGYHAVAVDLRGYGASDKPPRGYDGYTLADDVAGLIRALGERNADLVGHDWGGFLAWTAAQMHPRLVRSICVLGSPHPSRLRAAIATDAAQAMASRYLFAFQAPRTEHYLTRDDAGYVATLLERWAGQRWRASDDFAVHARRCRTAMQIPQAAFCAMEYHRWAVRSLTRPSGWKFARMMAVPISAPVLQIQGDEDSCTLPRTAAGAGKYVAGHREAHLLDHIGHLPHLEAPDTVNELLLRWLTGRG